MAQFTYFIVDRKTSRTQAITDVLDAARFFVQTCNEISDREIDMAIVRYVTNAEASCFVPIVGMKFDEADVVQDGDSI